MLLEVDVHSAVTLSRRELGEGWRWRTESECKATALSREICLQSFQILTSVGPVNHH